MTTPNETLIKFNEDDVSADCKTVGPEYFASRRLAEAMMRKFEAEHLKSIVDMISTAVSDKLWDDVRDYLLQDTESNIQGAVENMVQQTIDALLTGKEWAMRRYPYAEYSRGEEIRKAVAVHGGDVLLAQRIQDLEAELAKVNATIKWLRQ